MNNDSDSDKGGFWSPPVSPVVLPVISGLPERFDDHRASMAATQQYQVELDRLDGLEPRPPPPLRELDMGALAEVSISGALPRRTSPWSSSYGKGF